MKSDQGFPVRLTAAMERSGGKSGAQLGREIGVAGSTVNDWKRGESEPTLSNLISAAERLGVSVQWLATGEGEMHPTTLASAQQAAPSEPPLDKWLFSRVIDGIRTAYKVAGAQLPVVQEVDKAIDMHNRIAALTDVQEERYGALLVMLDDLEQDLRSPRATEAEDTKRSA